MEGRVKRQDVGHNKSAFYTQCTQTRQTQPPPQTNHSKSSYVVHQTSYLSENMKIRTKGRVSHKTELSCNNRDTMNGTIAFSAILSFSQTMPTYAILESRDPINFSLERHRFVGRGIAHVRVRRWINLFDFVMVDGNNDQQHRRNQPGRRKTDGMLVAHNSPTTYGLSLFCRSVLLKQVPSIRFICAPLHI
jgi:hypothetical protein